MSPDVRLTGSVSLADLRRYLRALAAFYIRLTFRSMEIYELLEPLMKDYRKLRIRQVGESQYVPLSHVKRERMVLVQADTNNLRWLHHDPLRRVH